MTQWTADDKKRFSELCQIPVWNDPALLREWNALIEKRISADSTTQATPVLPPEPAKAGQVRVNKGDGTAEWQTLGSPYSDIEAWVKAAPPKHRRIDIQSLDCGEWRVAIKWARGKSEIFVCADLEDIFSQVFMIIARHP
jgi:hypothetical protein